MQSSLRPTWIIGLAARNDPENIRLRAILRFSVLYLIAFIAGTLLCSHTRLGSSATLRSLAESALDNPFANCEHARDFIRTVLNGARMESVMLALIALSGLTYISRSAANAVLAAHAGLFGSLSYTFLQDILSGATFEHGGNFAFFLYFFARLASAGILLSTATEAVIFSYAYRDASHNSGDRLSAQFALQCISYAGMLLIVHAAYATLLAFLEKAL